MKTQDVPAALDSAVNDKSMTRPGWFKRLVAQEGTFDSISVLGDGNLSQDELVGRRAAAVPDGVEVVSGEASTVESQDGIREDVSFFSGFMRPN